MQRLVLDSMPLTAFQTFVQEQANSAESVKDEGSLVASKTTAKTAVWDVFATEPKREGDFKESSEAQPLEQTAPEETAIEPSTFSDEVIHPSTESEMYSATEVTPNVTETDPVLEESSSLDIQHGEENFAEMDDDGPRMEEVKFHWIPATNQHHHKHSGNGAPPSSPPPPPPSSHAPAPPPPSSPPPPPPSSSPPPLPSSSPPSSLWDRPIYSAPAAPTNLEEETKTAEELVDLLLGGNNSAVEDYLDTLEVGHRQKMVEELNNCLSALMA